MPAPNPAEITRAADTLAAGGLVAFPTETVYGLGADAASEAAVTRLFAVKGRPVDHPVIVHLASAARLETWARDVSPGAIALADAFWPGPLTLVLGRAPGVSDLVTGGLDTVGIRVPDQPVALALLQEFGGGVAAPSANRFGRVSPTTAADVRADLGDDVDVVLDGGACRVGVESTIVDVSRTDPTILRIGGVLRDEVEDVLGRRVLIRTDGEVRAPGTHASHYAPDSTVVLVPEDELVGQALDALSVHGSVGVVAMDLPPELDQRVTVVGRPADVDEFARSLYRYLREADERGLDALLVVPPPAVGIGAAVADRLGRAATPSAKGARG